jgi:hypothetical protein
MVETLAMMRWIGEIDGNNIESVFAPSSQESRGKFHPECTNKNLNCGGQFESEALGKHSLWVLDFDLCREMAMDSAGVEQTVIAFWRNGPFFPRPGKLLERDSFLWMVFRESYLRTSTAWDSLLVW